MADPRRLGWLYKEQKNIEKSEQEFAGARLVIHTLEANISDETFRTHFVQAALGSLPKERTLSKRQQDAETFGGLTPREREVARFVSQGKSNREIAEGLVLSERTVETHVGNILTKLGFDSRAQIAVWAVEKRLVELAPDRFQTRNRGLMVRLLNALHWHCPLKPGRCGGVSRPQLRKSLICKVLNLDTAGKHRLLDQRITFKTNCQVARNRQHKCENDC
jgi:DNA-binding CsgD family transcriptional regulator